VSNVNTFGTGNIKLTADSISLAGVIDAETRRVTLVPKTNGWPINLGGGDNPTQLGLDTSDISAIFAGTINIGDAASGPITVSQDITRPTPTIVNLTSGGVINFLGGLVNTAGGNLLLTPGSTAKAI